MIGPLKYEMTQNRAMRIICFFLSLSAVDFCLAALPVGESVRHGDVEFVRGDDTLTVIQNSPKAVIDWEAFSIGSGRLAEFIHAGSDSAVLNRVTGHLSSEIHGKLTGEGRIILLNPNGILIGPNGRIDAAGFIASTLDVTDADFLNGGNLEFVGDSGAAVVSFGRIEAFDGDVFLIAREIWNEGEVRAPVGTAGFAAGNDVLLRADGEERISIRHSVTGGRIEQRGLVEAVVAELQAAGGNEYALAINNGGIVRATGVEERDGRILLKAEDGDVRHHGKLEASSKNGHALIHVTGSNIEIDETSRIGAQEGGTGGEVRLVASKEMDFAGSIDTGTQGVAEISGIRSIRISGNVNTRGGLLLFDPADFTVGNQEGDDITGGTLAGMLQNQNVAIETASGSGGEGDIRINDPVLWESPYSLSLLAHRHIEANASVQSDGDGDVILVAGWDGVTGFDTYGQSVDTGSLLDTPGAFGNNDGSIFLGDSTQDQGIAVGSRFGETVAFGRHLNLFAGLGNDDLFAQLGFRPDQDVEDYLIDGGITIALEGDLNARAHGTGIRNYVQVGHGAVFLQGPDRPYQSYHGDITIERAADLSFAAGDGFESYAQLGHGGRGAEGNRTGDITIKDVGNIIFSAGNGTYAYSHLGHGGGRADITRSGDIIIHRAEDMVFTAGGGSGGASAHLGHGGWRGHGDISGDIGIGSVRDLVFSGVQNSYAQLGHGGWDQRGDRDGDIMINEARDLIFTSGAGSSAPARLGHGEYAGRGDSRGDIAFGTVRNLLFTADASEAQLGHGGRSAFGDRSGNISIGAVHNIRFHAGELSSGNVHFGHGGRASGGNFSGNITMDMANDISFIAGNGTNAYAHLGHGGQASEGLYNGKITILEANDLNFLGGGGNYAYVHFGHGGFEIGFERGQEHGDIAVWNAANLILSAGEQRDAYAQLGHGGPGRINNQSGNIVLNLAGNLALSAGSQDRAYVLLGHGGRNTFGSPLRGERSGSIAIRAAGDTVLADNGDPDEQHVWHVGHLTWNDEDLTDAGVQFITGTLAYDSNEPSDQVVLNELFFERFRQNLPGGDVTIGATGSGGLKIEAPFAYQSENDLNLLSTHDIFIGAGVQNHGSGRIQVASGWNGTSGMSVSGFSFSDILADSDNYAGNEGNVYIGDGTQESGIAFGSRFGNTSVAGNSLSLRAGANDDDLYAQLGFRPEVEMDGSEINGAILIVLSGDLIARAGQGGTRNYAQVGHGAAFSPPGVNPEHHYRGDISIERAADVRFLAGEGESAYAQLGHGGESLAADLTGEIVLGEVGEIAFGGGAGNYANARLGHGGRRSGGDHSGSIRIERANDLTFSGGVALGSNVQLGHGGSLAFGDQTGAITIVDVERVVFSAGRGYAHLGHGGDLGALPLGGHQSGAISIEKANELNFTGGTDGNSAYSQLGHGGSGRPGTNQSGDITVSALGNIVFSGGTEPGTYAQLGHGGTVTSGRQSGAIVLNSDGNLTIAAGPGRWSYAQLGHGGFASSGDKEGDLSLNLSGDMIIAAGEGTQAYAILGHGGFGTTPEEMTGQREGALEVTVAGQSTLVDHSDPSESRVWHLGHLTSTENGIGNSGARFLTGTLGYDMNERHEDIVLNDRFAERFTRNIEAGSVMIGASGGNDVRVEGNFTYSGSEELVFLSGKSLSVTGTIQNSSEGTLIFVVDNGNPDRPDFDEDARFSNRGEISVSGGGEIFVYAVRPGNVAPGNLQMRDLRFDVYYGDEVAGGGIFFKISPRDFTANDVLVLLPPDSERFYGEPEHRLRLPFAGFDSRYGPHPGPMERPIAPAFRYEGHPGVTLPEWDNGFVSMGVFSSAGTRSGDEKE